MAKTRKYKDHLNERLQDPAEAVGYLNAALEDDDLEVFLLALRDVADAQGGVRAVAEKGHLNRESLYRTLSKKGNPRLSNLKAVLEAMGLHLSLHTDARCRYSNTPKNNRRPSA